MGLLNLSMRAALPAVSLAVYAAASRHLPPVLATAFSSNTIPGRLSITTALLSFYLAASCLASLLDAAMGVNALFHLASIGVPLLLLAQDDYRVADWLCYLVRVAFHLIRFILFLAGVCVVVVATALMIYLVNSAIRRVW